MRNLLQQVTKPIICFVGDFPPPITGAAKNNEKVAGLLEGAFHVRRLDTSGGKVGLRRTLRYLLRRLHRNLSAITQVTITRLAGPLRIYHVPNAGQGQIYTLLLACIGSLLAEKIVFHHRGFSYVDRYSLLMRWITQLTAHNAVHVFLANRMEEEFKKQYPCDLQAQVVSNVSLLDFAVGNSKSQLTRPSTIGHLGNLCPEKGFDYVIDVFEAVAGEDDSLTLLLAGPFVDNKCEQRFRRLKQQYGSRVDHIGPVWGKAKREFYDNVDFFLFPTCYAVEAEPNVVWEALARGCPTAAYTRGCISEMLPTTLGLPLHPNESFTARVVPWIVELVRNEPKYLDMSREATAFVREKIRESSEEFEKLKAVIR